MIEMNRQVFLVFAFLLVVVLGGLVSIKLYEAHERELGAKKLLSSFDQISLERTSCYGPCPVYRVSVSGTGDVSYEGFSDVERVGTASKHLDAESMRRLLAALNEARYFGFRDSYRTELDGCPGVATDNSTVITSVSAEGRVKRIDHYLGCEQYDPNGSGADVIYPAELASLEEHLDEIIGTREWTGWPRRTER